MFTLSRSRKELTVISQHVQKPNPENADAMKLGLLLAKGSRCDILIATDPDCDRIGVAVDHRGEWKQLTGNELGLVLLDYLARRKSEHECDMSHKVACTSIVSGPMANDIALKYGFSATSNVDRL